MTRSEIFKDYVGQLRLYSLVDFGLLLYAFDVSRLYMVGAISLWIGFLAYLEWRHSHVNRLPVPAIVWILCFGLGVFLIPSVFTLAFIFLCVLYAEKIGGIFGLVSPLVRGVQTVVILSGLVSPFSSQIIVSGFAVALRNLLGDFRDTQKDRRQGLRTVPVVLGLKNDYRYIHLVGILATSFLWWSWSPLPFIVLVVVWGIEIVTYNLTSR